MLPLVSNDRATPARSLRRKSLSISVPAQQKSGARDRVQPPLGDNHCTRDMASRLYLEVMIIRHTYHC